MARLARAEVFAPDEVAVIHVMNRVVRRCFLLGDDPVSGKNFDHRKVWIERYLEHFAASFGIDLCVSIDTQRAIEREARSTCPQGRPSL